MRSNKYNAKNPFLWALFENSTNDEKLNIIYDELYDMNMVLDSGRKIPLTVSNIFFRKTLTKTMVKKETDDEDQ
jgi:hypothetical protein